MRVAVLDDYQGVATAMADWSILPPEVELRVFRDHEVDEQTVAEGLKEFDIIIGMRERTPFPRSLLERLPRLKLLITTGMANVSFDMDAATELGIVVEGTTSSGVATAELTWGLILAVTRHIPQEDRATRTGQWQTTVGLGLRGNTLGVMGLGRIGPQIAEFGRTFQMSVIAWSPNLTPERAAECGATLVTKDELFALSDVVTIHLRLGDRTRGLITGRELALMKPTAYLINTSRGSHCG